MVKGIECKPIIDISIGVEDIWELDDFFFEQLKTVGFYKLRVQKNNEIVCAKYSDNAFQVKIHIIHVVNFKQEKWNELVLFRDIINKNSKIKKQYEDLKYSFLKATIKE